MYFKGLPVMLGNLFGTRERLHFIFRHSLPAVEAVLRAKADPAAALKRPLRSLAALPGLVNMCITAKAWFLIPPVSF